MKSRLPMLLATILALTISPVGAQDEIVFKLYDPNAPEARVGGSTRGADSELTVAVLAPNRLAVTTRASPPLYWFASAPVSDPVELVLILEGAEDPLVKVVLEPPLPAGIHAFEIPSRTELATDSTYQWSVAVVPDPNSRSHDVFASALMTRVPEPADPNHSGDVRGRAVWLAGRGIWYDAIAELSHAIAESSNQGNPARVLRARLLEQVGLANVAQFELQAMNR